MTPSTEPPEPTMISTPEGWDLTEITSRYQQGDADQSSVPAYVNPWAGSMGGWLMHSYGLTRINEITAVDISYQESPPLKPVEHETAIISITTRQNQGDGGEIVTRLPAQYALQACQDLLQVLAPGASSFKELHASKQ